MGKSPAVPERYETLELERDGPLLFVWLARPAKRNALNGTALAELEALFTALQRDFATRVVVLGGRGASFCAGADRDDPPGSERMRAASGASARERRFTAQLGRRACAAIEALEAVTIARLHGHALGGGLALALACDFRFAAEGTQLALPEVDLGVPLTWGATPRLIHEIGAARARELLLLGDALEAGEAQRIGLVHRVLPAADLDAAVLAAARKLAAKPEIAVHMTKTQLRAYARRAALGDVSEADADLLLEASRVGVARDSFRREPPTE
jgi:enoyl-CoA hydratase/carnithine racemase